MHKEEELNSKFAVQLFLFTLYDVFYALPQGR